MGKLVANVEKSSQIILFIYMIPPSLYVMTHYAKEKAPKLLIGQ